MSYIQQRSWADSFNGQLTTSAEDFIYSNRLLDIQTRMSTANEDQRLGIDAVSSFDNITWAFRVRAAKAYKYWANEFTLRYRELDKVCAGTYADYLIYGLEDANNPLMLSKVKLLDIRSVAKQLNKDEDLKDRVLGTEVTYNSSQNSFLCLRYSWFPEPIVIDEAILSPYNSLSDDSLGVGIGEYGKPARIALKQPSWVS